MDEIIEVKIRFNTNFPIKSDKKWRLLIKDYEYLYDEISIKCPSDTSVDEVKNEFGELVTKYHIKVLCSEVSVVLKEEKITAILY